MVKPARLEARRHEEKIRPSFDPVRQSFIKSDSHRDLGWKLQAESFEGLFTRRNPGAEQSELEFGGEHFAQGSEHDIHAFLFNQPSDAAEEGNGCILRQAKFFL